MKEFENLIEKKLKFGLYQKRLLFISIFLQTLTGCFQLTIYIAAPLLTADWFLTSFQSSSVLSLPSFAMLLGAYIIGYLSDLLNRPLIIKSIYLITLTAIVFLYYANSYIEILPIFLIFGFYNSCTLNVMFTYVGEMIPQKQRGKILTLISGVAGVGRLATVLICFQFINPYQIDNWKIPFFVYGLVLSISYSALLFWMKPSLYQLHKQSKYKQLYKTFQEIQKINAGSSELLNKNLAINKTDIDFLIENEVQEVETSGKLSKLFSKKNRRKSIALFFLRGLLACVFTGELTVTPSILGTDNKNLGVIFFILIGEFFGTLICSILIDRIGRRTSILLATFFELISMVTQIFLPVKFWPVTMFLRRIFVRYGFSAVEIYSIEAYDPDVRSTAFGINMTFSGLCVGGSSLILLKLFNLNPNYLFGFWSCAISGALLAGSFLPSDPKIWPKPN